MAKKYLKLKDAAKRLGITSEQLAKEREAGAIRGFANRGSWKFREEDIDEFARSRETDSSPEIPLEALDPNQDTEEGVMDLMDSSDSDVKLYSKSSLFDGDDTADLSGSDSDVRLAGDSGPTLESDDSSPSGEKVIEFDDSDNSLTDSDSDVKMVGAGTDPDISLADDSDLKLLDPLQGTSDEGRDSDGGLNSSDDDSGISLDIDDSGISLEADDSGISLEGVDSSFDADSGISLDSVDSGISLDSGDSGISLEADQDSGISIEVDDGGIVAVDSASDDAGAETLQMDLLGSDSEFDLGLLEDDEQDTGTDTSVLMMDDDGGATDTDFSAMDGEEAFQDDEFIDDFDDDMDDVFEADDEEDFASGQSNVGLATPTGPAGRAVETPWGTGVTVGIVGGSVFSVLGAFAGLELVRTMWMWFQPGTGGSEFLNFLGGLFV
ncbi:MAG: hypothetical protein MK102_07930 [Fuerstiella sp.]|nr:hypothetical protein [Fuerstiella sp.]